MTATAVAAPPATPPPPVVVATGGPDRRPCAICGTPTPTEGPGSSWPWTNQQRICQPCLRRIDA